MSHPLARLHSALAPTVPLSDLELLTHFLDRDDQNAFAELVRRYGPMVFGVCRRTLGNGPDAEDAYQAAFFVLAKRAATARGIGNLAGWLHRVATLCAKKASVRRAKQRLRERAEGVLADVPTIENPLTSDLSAILDEELATIPERYRTAVVLCELRQLTLDQAAAELGIPRGTVASRLARGREALGKRLLRRGLSVVLPTQRPAFDLPSYHPSPTAQSLSREVLRTMITNHFRWLPVVLLPLIAVVAGFLAAADSPKPVTTVSKPEEKVKRNATVDRVKLVGVGGLLEHEAVRRDIGLTKAQIEKVDLEKEKLVTGIKEFGKTERRAKQEDALQVRYLLVQEAADLALKFDAAVVGLLTADQVYRVKQISLQRDGPVALLGRFAARELALSPDQEDELAEVVKPLTKPKLFDIPAEFAGKGIPPGGKLLIQQHAATVDRVKDKAIAVLSATQKKRWGEMVGEELPTDVLLLTSGDGYLLRLAMSSN